MKPLKPDLKKFEEQARKDREEAEEKELERRIRPDPVTQAIISHLQNHGSATVDEIVASSPIAHLIEERAETLYQHGRLKKKGDRYVLTDKKYKPKC